MDVLLRKSPFCPELTQILDLEETETHYGKNLIMANGVPLDHIYNHIQQFQTQIMMFYSDTKLINNLQVLYIRKEYTYLSGGGYPNKLATLSNHIYKSDRSTQQPQRQKNQIQNNKQLTLTLCCKCLSSLACLECKMPKFQSVGMKEGGGPLPLAFQYLIILI